MRDAATQDRRRNELAKLWIFPRNCERRRRRHAPRLTATAVSTDSRHRFSKRWYIAGDDQTTLMVHRNSANIVCTSTFMSVYVCAIVTIVPRLTAAAIATNPHRHISKRWHIADIKNFTEDDQSNLTVDWNSTNTKIYAYEIKQNVSKNFFILLRMTPQLTALHTFFLLSLATTFVFTFEN